MPKKGHRAASRQAQLRQRKRRGRGQSQVFDAGPVAPSPDIAVEERPDAVEAEPVPAPEPRQTSTRDTRRSRQRAAAAAEPLTLPYLGAELKRIAAFSTLISHLLYGGITGFSFYAVTNLYSLARPAPPVSEAEGQVKRGVILGGGFGGISTARYLEQKFGRDPNL